MYYGYRCVDWLHYGGDWGGGVLWLALACKPQGVGYLIFFFLFATLCHISIATFLEVPLSLLLCFIL